MKPKIIGYWAIQVTPQMDFVKFGKDGDTIFPYPTAKQAIRQCLDLNEEEDDCRYFILRLFDNGQMKTFYAF